MAKYSRYDPRNKNQGRNKQLSIEKDLRIKEVYEGDHHKPLLREVVNDSQDYLDEDANQFLTENNNM